MSDIGPIPAKDQTNYLLGRLEGSMNALKDTVTQSSATQAQATTQHELEHAEFRKDIGNLVSDVAVLKDNKTGSSTARSNLFNQIMIWITGLGILAAVILQVIQLTHP